MLLLHVYASNPKYKERTRETWEALESIESSLLFRGWTIRHEACSAEIGEDGLSDYERLVLALWGLDDLVVLEHDIVPTLDMLIRLEPNPYPVCAQAYPLFLDGDMLQNVDKVYSMMQQLSEKDRKKIEEIGIITQAYYLWHAAYKPDIHAKNRYIPTLAHRIVEEEPNKHRWILDGEQWADYYGLGLTRFSKEFQQAVPPNWERGPWDNLDSRMSKYTHSLGIRAHVHYPVAKHNHVGAL